MDISTQWLLVIAALIIYSEAKQGTNGGFLMTVKTGSGKEAGTFSKVLVVFEDENGRTSKPFNINRNSRGHLQQGKTDQHRIPIPKDFGGIVTMKLTNDNRDILAADWYCEQIFVDDPRINERFYFPIERRIEGNVEYVFENYAASLPQDDLSKEARELTLKNKRKEYEFNYRNKIGMVANTPRDELFYEDYHDRWYSWRLLIRQEVTALGTSRWWSMNNTLSDYDNIYDGNRFYLPKARNRWSDDIWFGAQRVQGLVPYLIELCRQIPEKLGVTEVTVRGLLEGYTLQQALRNNKIFIVDLDILEGTEYDTKFMTTNHSAPIALFYLNKKDILMPIAIQLNQRKGPYNPVYTPKDPSNTWLVAKLYYNNAEAQYHTALAHFGLTHLLLESIVVSTNRQLSPSHPVFMLLKPHYHQTIPTNLLGEQVLALPGSPVEAWSMGSWGLQSLLVVGIDRFTVLRSIGSVVTNCKVRGVMDKEVLPYYPYRDDSIDMYNIIKKYVTTILSYYYDTPSKVRDDWELKNWRAEMTRPTSEGGVGIPDLPGSSNGFSELSEVIDMVTWIISHASIGHAATHFLQYEEFGYEPNYPSILMKPTPTCKRDYTDADILDLLPNPWCWVTCIGSMRGLVFQGTNDLGDFEKRFLYDPVSVKAHNIMKDELKNFSKVLDKRNKNRMFPYVGVHPNFVPNSVSI